jgi:TonB family protein
MPAIVLAVAVAAAGTAAGAEAPAPGGPAVLLAAIDECLAATPDDERAALRVFGAQASAGDPTPESAAGAITALRSIALERCAGPLRGPLERGAFWTLEYVFSRVVTSEAPERAPSQVGAFAALLLAIPADELRRFSDDPSLPALRNVTGRLFRAAAPVPMPAGLDPARLCPYPFASRVRGEEGAVVLGLLVEPSGVVSRAEVETSSGYPALDDAPVVCAAATARFEHRPSGPWHTRIKWTWRLES